MKKLGKTATQILTHMKARSGVYGATSATGRGPEGRLIKREGGRKFDACAELVAKGYAIETGRRFFTMSRRGCGMSCSEISIRLA